ncbi:hypothetical protein PR048_009415 [Dryococelus australis]|uniref:Cytochrome b5 heme-binding domain-containing protein n=1 Tax=Dryococelus australis TaxID=614101 RepID=A0ABQ9HZT7_9NEOP|nr:hypothetical protein PR048_009415 [Dryococelus australis]
MQWVRRPSRRVQSSLPGLKYPSHRDDPVKSSTLWLQGKREDDGAEGLWRVHDGLYDLSSWLHHHPGGADWLELTKVPGVKIGQKIRELAKVLSWNTLKKMSTTLIQFKKVWPSEHRLKMR